MKTTLYEKILRKILQESVTDIVYHFTYIDALLNILKTNKLMTTAAFGTAVEFKHNRKKMFYFSTARSTTSSYFQSGPDSVVLVLDGRRLSHSHKAAPVDYFGPLYRKMNKSKFEQEDRIFTDKPYIEPATKYIQEIHILLDVDAPTSKHSVETLREVENLTTSLDLSLYLYSSAKNFRLLRRNGKIKSIDDFVQQGTIEDNKFSSSDYGVDKHLIGLVNLLQMNFDRDALSPEGKEVYKRLKFSYQPDDVKFEIGVTIHNNRSKPKAREYIVKIAKFIRKHKLKDLDGLAQFIHEHIKEKRYTEY